MDSLTYKDQFSIRSTTTELFILSLTLLPPQDVVKDFAIFLDQFQNDSSLSINHDAGDLYRR